MDPQGPKKSGASISCHEFDKGTYQQFGKYNYCSGRVKYVDDTQVEVTFVFYDSIAKAKKVFNRYSDLNNEGVVRVWSIGDAVGSEFEGKEFYVVSFGKFLGFFTEDRLQYIQQGFSTGQSSLEGIPTSWVISLILDLIKAIKYLFSLGLASNFFDLPMAYVWCLDARDNTYKLKVFLIDEEKTDYEEDEWNWVLQDCVTSFGKLLEDHILVHPSLGILKECFLEGFDVGMSIVPMPAMKRLCMLETSPFFEENVHKILALAWLANMDRTETKLHDYDLVEMKRALQQPQLFRQVCPCGNWLVGITSKFEKYLDGRMQEAADLKDLRKGTKSNYQVTSKDIVDDNLETLIKWIRNAFVYGEMSESDIYMEVMRSWPTLFSRLHTVMWHYRTRW